MLESTALNWDVFDDDCRQYLATHLEQHEDVVYDVVLVLILTGSLFYGTVTFQKKLEF